MTTFTLLVVWGFIGFLLSAILLLITEAPIKINRITRGIITGIGLVLLCASLWSMIIGGIWGICHLLRLLHWA